MTPSNGFFLSLFRLRLGAVAAMAMLVAGCVTSGTFEQKAREADTLGNELMALREEQAALVAKNRELEARQGELSGEVASLAERNRKLEVEKKELEETAAAKGDALSQTLFSLRQQVADLMGTNESLKNELIGLVKTHDEKVKSSSASFEALLELMRDKIATGEASVSELKGTLTVTLFEPLLFEPGAAGIKPSARTTLAKLAGFLKEGKSRGIRVEAYTETMISPSWSLKQYPTGWEFAAARAVAVTRALQADGVSPLDLAAISYGEYRPLSDNITELGRARNRRIQITIPPPANSSLPLH